MIAVDERVRIRTFRVRQDDGTVVVLEAGRVGMYTLVRDNELLPDDRTVSEGRRPRAAIFVAMMRGETPVHEAASEMEAARAVLFRERASAGWTRKVDE